MTKIRLSVSNDLRLAGALIHTTAAVIFLQLFAGGLLVFGFIMPTTHLLTGFLALGFAIVTMGMTLVSKPSYRPLRVLSIALVGMIFVQGILGFIAPGGATTLILIHFTNALLIYGIAISAIFFARVWNRILLTEKQGPVIIALVISAAVWGALFASAFFPALGTKATTQQVDRNLLVLSPKYRQETKSLGGALDPLRETTVVEGTRNRVPTTPYPRGALSWETRSSPR